MITKNRISRFIILILILTISNTINAQYQSLFGSNSTSWNVYGYDLGAVTDSTVTNSETIINDITYKRLISFKYVDFELDPIESTAQRFIREDLTTGKVWYKGSEQSNELLIMDLSLEVGDLFFVSPGTWNTGLGNYPVEEIWVENGRKHIKFDCTINTAQEKLTFIEGIGPNIGLQHQHSSTNGSPYLLCSYKNENIEYQNSQHPQFAGLCLHNETAAIGDEELNYQIIIYPNPVKDILTIEEQSNIEIESTSIYNYLGQKLVTAQQRKIDMSNLKTGVYLVKIKLVNGQIVSKKIIK